MSEDRPAEDRARRPGLELPDRQRGVGGRNPASEFLRRLEREIDRNGLRGAAEIVAVTDGADWIRNTLRTAFAGQRLTLILDAFHALEYLSDALKALIPDKAAHRAKLGNGRQSCSAAASSRGPARISGHG